MSTNVKFTKRSYNTVQPQDFFVDRTAYSDKKSYADEIVDVLFLDDVPCYFAIVTTAHVGTKLTTTIVRFELIELYDKANGESKNKSIELLKIVFQTKEFGNRLKFLVPNMTMKNRNSFSETTTTCEFRLYNARVENYDCTIPEKFNSEPISFSVIYKNYDTLFNAKRKVFLHT